jgi:hypothetical protein
MLTLTPGAWANTTSQTETWESCVGDLEHLGAVATGPCTPIAVDGDAYAISSRDDFDSIAVVETATGPGGTSNYTIEAPEVEPPPSVTFRDTTPPRLSAPGPNTASPGQTITLYTGNWAFGSVTKTEWQLCFSVTKCVDINPQPTGDTWVVPSGAGDEHLNGWFVQVYVTATGAGTTTVLTAPAITIVSDP